MVGALETVLTRSAGDGTAFIEVDPGRGPWSDAEFGGLVSAVGARLDDLGVRAGDRVALLLPKSVSSVAVLFALLRDGVIAVPLDPMSPPDRVAHMLRDCAPALVVVDAAAHERFADRLRGIAVVRAGAGPADRSVPELPDRGAPVSPAALFDRSHPDDETAYILYTSGTTGMPKGVAVSRGALAAFLRAAVSRAGYSRETVFLSFFPLHFDPVLMELLAPWAVGGRTVLFGGLAMINDLVSALREHRVTDFSCTPNAISMMVGRFSSYPARPVASLRSVWFGGEVPNPHDIATFQALSPWVRLFNGYGPTECTIACSLWDVPDLRAADPGAPLPIGVPMEGTHFVVVGADGEPVGDGVRGELLVAGAQVMLGYWGHDGDEANGMVRLGGRRHYRTGDLVHRSRDVYHFDGRISRLVKVRGYRVHPGEVEHVLESAGGVRQAVVVEQASGAGLDALVEVDAGAGAGATDARALRTHLAERLPDYMIPGRIVAVDRLPRTAGGKVDMEGVAHALRHAPQ